MTTIHAIFEDGVFRPQEPVDLPEHAQVEFEPRIISIEQKNENLDSIYAILSERYASGDTTGAERHNEHQP